MRGTGRPHRRCLLQLKRSVIRVGGLKFLIVLDQEFTVPPAAVQAMLQLCLRWGHDSQSLMQLPQDRQWNIGGPQLQEQVWRGSVLEQVGEGLLPSLALRTHPGKTSPQCMDLTAVPAPVLPGNRVPGQEVQILQKSAPTARPSQAQVLENSTRPKRFVAGKFQQAVGHLRDALPRTASRAQRRTRASRSSMTRSSRSNTGLRSCPCRASSSRRRAA